MPVFIDWQEEDAPTTEEQEVLEEAVLVMEEQLKEEGKRFGIITANRKRVQEAIKKAKAMAKKQVHEI